MRDAWLPKVTDEERSLQRFKDALMERAPAAVRMPLFLDSEEELIELSVKL